MGSNSNLASTEIGTVSVDNTRERLVRNALNFQGSVSVSAGGNLVAEEIYTRGSVADDAVSLTTTGVGSDVVVGRIFTFNRESGISLTAADDIRPAASDSSRNLLFANGLTLVADNNLQEPDRFNGIFIDRSRVLSLSAEVRGTDEAEIFVQNILSALTVTDASVNTGIISITNQQRDLTVERASIANGNDDSQIQLRTIGSGDVRVEDLFARGSMGVFLDSADDIFDTSFMDDIFIDADFVRARSVNAIDEAFDGIFLSVGTDSVSTTALNSGSEVLVNRS